MSTNDEYKKVEAMLYNYNKTRAEIKNLKLDLEILENDYIGVGSITYEERTGPTNKFNSSVENEIIKRDEKIIKLRSKIRLKEIDILKVDNAIESLEERDSCMIREYYLNNKQLKVISRELSLDENYCSSYKSRLIEELSNLIFNKEVS